MNRLSRIAATGAATVAIATAGLVGGTAQANAAPGPISVRSAFTAVTDNLTPTAFTPYLCKKYRWLPPICPRQP